MANKKITLSSAQTKMLAAGAGEYGVRIYNYGEETELKRAEKLVTMGLMTRTREICNSRTLWVYKTVQSSDTK